MVTVVPLLFAAQVGRLPERAREVVEYRKSGLSLNHVQGCPLDCAYCIRHTYGLWDVRQPRALMSDTQAVDELVSHHYFQPHITPVQVFNRATDPFLPTVRTHTFAVLENLDGRGLTNHVLVITRHQMKAQDAERLNQLRYIKATLLFTYSGIDDKRIEPYPSDVAAESLVLMSSPPRRKYRTVLYWRPLVPGLNDTDEHLHRACELGQHADATVFTGLFYRAEIAAYYKANGLPEPYEETARRKIIPETLEQRVLSVFTASAPLFRKTSCAVSYAHGLPDYNGHYGVRELCDICPLSQVELCAGAHRVPSPDRLHRVANELPETRGVEIVDITDRAAVVSGLGTEQPRYYLQHALGFQVHDVAHPHRERRHGRADIGWRTQAAMTDWTSRSYVVVDVEGNGQQPPDLVELAVVPIIGGVIGEPSSWLVKPDTPITHFACKIHGITNDTVADAPVFDVIKPEVLHALAADGLIAHNAHVDMGVLHRKLGDWECPEIFDTLKLTRRFLPDMGSYKLGALVEAFTLAKELPDGLTPHRATYDALVTARLFVRLATLPRALSLEELRNPPSGGGGDDPPVLF